MRSRVQPVYTLSTGIWTMGGAVGLCPKKITLHAQFISCCKRTLPFSCIFAVCHFISTLIFQLFVKTEVIVVFTVICNILFYDVADNKLILTTVLYRE